MRRALIFVALAAATTAAHVRPVHAAVEDDLRDGDTYFSQGDWKRAAAAYDRAIAKAPGEVDAAAYGKRAAIYIILKDYQGGLAFISRATARFPHAPEVLEQQALILWQTGAKDQAIRIAQQVVAMRPETFSNQKLIGQYYAARDPAKTATAFEAYLAHRPAELASGDELPRLRLGFAQLALARAAVGDGDAAKAHVLYGKAVAQFDEVARTLGKKPEARVNADNGLCAGYAGLGLWDQATTVCERIVADPRDIDAHGSAWFNLGEAYLARRQTTKARSAAQAFLALRRGEARGHVLIGDTYYADRDYPHALDQYLQAEKLVKPGDAHEQVDLAIRLGETYRRMPAPAAGPNDNLAKAIDELARGYAANPGSVELAIELGDAYLDAQDDAKAGALADQLATAPAFAKARADQRADLLVIAGKARFARRDLTEARQRFAAAAQLQPGNVQTRRELVATIDEQAFEASQHGGAAQAATLLDQALAIDPSSTATLTDVAIVAIDAGQCDRARGLLDRLAGLRGTDAVLVGRLRGRAEMCGSHPDPKRAIAAFAAAEQEARKANATMALAEIYLEWAPLEWDTDLPDALAKLERAVEIAGRDPDLGPAAARDLALALYRRGWQLEAAGKPADAVAAFERATRDPSVLRGSEPLAFQFSYAIALVDAGRGSEAAPILAQLATRGDAGAYLQGPYAKAGARFFAAYATSRTATGAAREAACRELAHFEGTIGGAARELAASCWELAANDAWRAGSTAGAKRALTEADRTANAAQKRRLALDRIALALGKDKVGALEAMSGNPPEALVDLGIVYDLLGRPKDAYDAWVSARAKGVQARDLQRWIDAKRRIYGF